MTGGAATVETFGNDESVVQCLAIMGEIAEEQRGRNRHLDTKAGSIAGFAGTALTLNLTLGRPLLQQRFPSSPLAHGAIRDAFIASAALFAASVLAAVVGVLRPSGQQGFGRDRYRRYVVQAEAITMSRDLPAVNMATDGEGNGAI